MKRKTASFNEKYVCSLPESELKKNQRRRFICLLAAPALFVGTLFIKQKALSRLAESEHKLSTSLQTAYVFLVFFILLCSLYAIVCSLTRYKLAKEISAKNAPKKGFSGGTWTAFVLPIVLVCLYTLLTLGLIVYAFSFGSLAVLLMSIGSGALFYLAMEIGKNTYRGTTTLTVDNEKNIAALLSDDEASTDDFYED